MRSLSDFCELAIEQLTPRQRKRLFRRAFSHRCVRHALRTGFASQDVWAWDWAACVFTCDPSLLPKRLEFLRGIIDRCGVVCAILGSDLGADNYPLQRVLLWLVRSLIDGATREECPWLEPLHDVIIRQSVESLRADVRAENGSVPGEESCTLARACAFMDYCVRHHGSRLRPLLFRHGALEAVARLAGRAESYLVVRAVRFRARAS